VAPEEGVPAAAGRSGEAAAAAVVVVVVVVVVLRRPYLSPARRLLLRVALVEWAPVR
jgi:hypothetical protein